MTVLEVLCVVGDVCWVLNPLIWLNNARMVAKHELWIQRQLDEIKDDGSTFTRIVNEGVRETLMKRSKLK